MREGYRKPARNATIELYTGDEEDPFVQGLERNDKSMEYVFCDKCMNELRVWLKGGEHETDH